MDGRKICRLVPLMLLMVGVLAAIIVSCIAIYGPGETHPKVPYWKNDIVYQVYPRSLYDALPDGTGDLKGITAKVDYFKDLGIGAVWLSPIYASPMADFGYDISNFIDIDPIFGTMDDFNELLRTFHREGLKVIMDLVPNHSSDEHEWFKKSIKREAPYTDYYIWADPAGFNETDQPIPPNNWLSVFKGSAWTWVEERKQFYFHQFLDKQPDLNFRNFVVREEMQNIIRFWLDKGVDGFRVDAVKHIFEVEDIKLNEPVANNSGIDDPTDYGYLNHTLTVDQPETFSLLKEWRDLFDKYTDKLMMVEVVGSDIKHTMKYYGNDTVPLADFPFNFLLIDQLHNRTDVTGESLKSLVDSWLDNMPEGKWPNWVLGNHDNGRVGSRFGVDMIDAMNMMSLLLPGTAITYYGEEIGMMDTWISWADTQDPQGCRYGQDDYMEHSRDPARTPMQWRNDTNAGFTTTTNETWLPVNENYETVNVEAQKEEEFSHMKVYQGLAQLRKEEPFTIGQIAYPVITEDIFSFMRYVDSSKSHYLIVINTAEEDIVVDLHKSASIQLPEKGNVLLRSITDTSEETLPGSEVSLSNLKMMSGEGIVFSLPSLDRPID